MSVRKSRSLGHRSAPSSTVAATRPKRTAKGPIRILLADDHAVIRDGLRSLLSSDGLRVIAQATDGHEAVRLAREHQPDLAILDIAMPMLNGIDASREIASASPKTQAILLTVHSEDQYVLEAVRAGIRGYVLKTQVTEDLMRAIREVASGALYLSPSVSETVLRALRAKSHASADPLTPREREVLRLIADGKTTKQVAQLLGVSAKTADAHRTRLMAKLDIHETASLVRYAIRRGLIEA
jgi:two-component system, NarL family, response regulator NreC